MARVRGFMGLTLGIGQPAPPASVDGQDDDRELLLGAFPWVMYQLGGIEADILIGDSLCRCRDCFEKAENAARLDPARPQRAVGTLSAQRRSQRAARAVGACQRSLCRQTDTAHIAIVAQPAPGVRLAHD